MFDNIFLDESGNSGSRFWDIAQPFYLEGGWIVDSKKVENLNQLIKEKEVSYPVNLKETKGKRLAKSKRGQKLILEVIDELAQNDALPTLFIVEKRYMLAGKIIETYLDPEYNNSISYEDQRDLNHRQQLAEEVYKLDDSILEQFANAYKDKAPSEILTVGVRIVEDLNKAGNSTLAKKIENSFTDIEDQIKIEFDTLNLPKFRGLDSLNITAVVYFLQYFEQHFPVNCHIKHDEIDSFKEIYTNTFSLLKGAKSGTVFFKDRYLKLPLEKIQSFTFHDSLTTPMIRAADLLVGGASLYIDKLISGNSISSNLQLIGFKTMGHFLMDAISQKYPQVGPLANLGSVVTSEFFMKELINSLSKSS